MSGNDEIERVTRHREIVSGVPGLDAHSLPRRLMASWQRSEEYGVSIETVEPVFAGTVETDSLFFECGREVLTELGRTLVGEPISLMLTDADGLVLNRFSGDPGLLQALDKVHLAPGFSYSEREAGTNGVGLALADRVPTVVRAEEHYSASLCSYTCAAVPVLDPRTGRLEGSVNLTTWSRQSSGLLLALAQSAAGSTSSLMLARATGRRPRPAPRGEVFRVESNRLEPGAGTLHELSGTWTRAVAEASQALTSGRIVAAVGEAGAGRATLLAQAQRVARPRDRILCATSPAPHDLGPWLALWSPELGKPHTAVVVCDVDALPIGAAEQLRDLVVTVRAQLPPVAEGEPEGLAFAVTAERFEDIPAPLAALVETVVTVPPLRERHDDVLPLARRAAHRARGREVALTPAAEQALRSYAWPGNVDQLIRIVRHAATRADLIDVRHLPAAVLSGTNHRLSRIEAFERDEIVRVLTTGARSMREAVEELGMSRATIYRKLAQYDIHIPKP